MSAKNLADGAFCPSKVAANPSKGKMPFLVAAIHYP
jgi:hypothetical protein